MRLWHYKLIPYLPKSQLLAQWRELNSIFKKQDKHILINYIYEYKKVDLRLYTLLVIREMQIKNIKIKSFENAKKYFGWTDLFMQHIHKFKNLPFKFIVFEHHHDNRYLIQCFYNLQEKFDRGQKDFTLDIYNKLVEFMRNGNYIKI